MSIKLWYDLSREDHSLKKLMRCDSMIDKSVHNRPSWTLQHDDDDWCRGRLVTKIMWSVLATIFPPIWTWTDIFYYSIFYLSCQVDVSQLLCHVCDNGAEFPYLTRVEDGAWTSRKISTIIDVHIIWKTDVAFLVMCIFFTLFVISFNKLSHLSRSRPIF